MNFNPFPSSFLDFFVNILYDEQIKSLLGALDLSFVELSLIAVGLSMDAFAVSICKGLGTKKLSFRQALLAGVYFGGFQALMPLIGWLLGLSLIHI